jgi:predicted transcriptional regulator
LKKKKIIDNISIIQNDDSIMNESLKLQKLNLNKKKKNYPKNQILVENIYIKENFSIIERNR